LISPWIRLLLVVSSLLIAGWTLSLVRRGRLYVGYSLPFLLMAAAGSGLAMLPTLQPEFHGPGRITVWSEGALVLAASGIAAMFIYVLSQLTIIAGRTARLAQELAMRDAARNTPPPRSEGAIALRDPESVELPRPGAPGGGPRAEPSDLSKAPPECDPELGS